ncbi:lipoprotein ABC transporter permease [Microbacterium sp. NPDC087589]|uniref:lipoprotein ABC transporter permease n=1 Tax=Microbacterium sp. NPDC087589 TaxID=3364191 RepID=UPI00381AB2EF
MVVGTILTVMLTTGRTVGAEQQVLGSIDSAGTRSITVRAEAGAGVTSSVMDRLAGIEGIEWAAGFSQAVDATNSAVPDGVKVPVRLAFGSQFERLGVPSRIAVPGSTAWVSAAALEQLGMPDGVGGVALTNGAAYGVAGILDVPDFLRGLEPAVFVPQPTPSGDEVLSVVIVIADSPQLVAPVSDAVVSVLGADDPTKITVQTSEALAHLRGLIEGQLGSFSRGLVVALLGLTGMLVAVLLYSLVMMRRKDFGRRRALGATRGLIIGLLLAQTGMLALTGILVGSVLSGVMLFASGDPWPGLAFTAALGILTLITALLAALVPATIASRREPIRELRVP